MNQGILRAKVIVVFLVLGLSCGVFVIVPEGVEEVAGESIKGVGTEIRLTWDEGDQMYPVIWGDKVVWEDTNGTSYDIFLYNQYLEISI